ncbi:MULTISPECIES: polysaccharide deacetylase family protein [Salinibaculum]|uniref:polysaccharide deacetylase family protein n=1 Tax=Salinibaculum TaxID=2732368 RepID=UPI0030CD4EEE
MSVLDEHSFALCLTHDVDRPYKTYQSLYYAVRDRRPGHLLDLLPWREPFWTFEDIMRMEEDLGVRSAFYFLNEQHLFHDRPPREWVRPENWMLYLGRYSLDDPDIRALVRRLDDGGWEVGLHGSYGSYRDRGRLAFERERLESVLGGRVLGGRQHHLNLDRPQTWRYQADVGLRYDTSLGSSDGYGFQHGYDPIRPFDDEFVVFPLTLMEAALPAVRSAPERAWDECERLLADARDNGAVMTVLWHPCYFSDRDFPNYGGLYRRLVERALDMGAWVGPPGDLYRDLDHATAADREPASTAAAPPDARSDEERFGAQATGQD